VSPRRFSHVVGVDDAPLARLPAGMPGRGRGSVLVVGAVFSGLRLEGVLTTRVHRDGSDATGAIAQMIEGSRFAPQIQAVLLQGIALGGFNVVDVGALAGALAVPVLVVARRAPDLDAIRAALGHVRGGARKWRLIEQAGPMEPCADVFVQRAGLSLDEAEALVRDATAYGKIPEPLRTAHLVAGGLGRGESRGRT
jgi:endonuclease V-like protein UPF0215 family